MPRTLTQERSGFPTGAVGHPGRPKTLSTFLLLALTAVMLSLLFPPFYCFFLAPVALVPFCTIIIRRPLRMSYLGAYYLLGLGFFAPNLFWLGPVTVPGLIALALFLAIYFVIFAVGLHRLVVQMRLPATLAVPVVWTAVEFLRSTFVQGGFPWFMLGNCLTPMPLLIQGADIFGVWGLTFFLAMLNGFVVDFLRLPLRQIGKGAASRFSPVIVRLGMVAGGAVIFVVGYGIFRLAQTTTVPGPRVAVIQASFPQQVKDAPNSAGEIFATYREQARAAMGETPKPDLVAWPETMVPGWINDEFTTAPLSAFKDIVKPDEIQYLEMEQTQSLLYRAALQHDCDVNGVPQLIGYGYMAPKGNWNDSIRQNRTMLMLPQRGEVDSYAKIHIVPFGEYIPFRSLPIVGKWMVNIAPDGIDSSLTVGSAWTRFEFAGNAPDPRRTGAARYTFATPICFEDTMPEPARLMSAPQYANGRKTDFLINVSNDGWFHWVELDQHLQACQMRAVENRIPIARSVNTGNSGFIDSNGRVLKLVTNAQGNSIGAVGHLAMQIQIDSRVSFYSRIGDLLPIVCGILAAVLVGWTYVRPRLGMRSKEPAGQSSEG